MEQSVSVSITRRDVVAGLAVIAASTTAMAGADSASAQEKTLYERLGGVFAIAAVVDHFSDDIVKNSIVGQECGRQRQPSEHAPSNDGSRNSLCHDHLPEQPSRGDWALDGVIEQRVPD